MTDKLAEEILFGYRLKAGGMTEADMIEAMQAYHEAKMKEEVRKCASCGSPLSDYCECCQHLWES